MTLVSTKTTTGLVLAPKLSHRRVGSATSLPLAPNCIQGLHGRLVDGARRQRWGWRVHLRHGAREDVARLRLHGALVAGSLDAQQVFDGFFQISNGQGGAHGKSVGIASNAVNAGVLSGCTPLLALRLKVRTTRFLHLRL